METIIILSLFAVGLYVYQSLFGKNPDELDWRGNPVYKGRNKRARR